MVEAAEEERTTLSCQAETLIHSDGTRSDPQLGTAITLQILTWQHTTYIVIQQTGTFRLVYTGQRDDTTFSGETEVFESKSGLAKTSIIVDRYSGYFAMTLGPADRSSHSKLAGTCKVTDKKF